VDKHNKIKYVEKFYDKTIMNSGHYDVRHIKKLVNEEFNNEILKLEIHQHLLECEECLSLYLSLMENKYIETDIETNIETNIESNIETEEISEVQRPTPNFTDKVMQSVNSECQRISKGKKRNRNVTTLLYYTSAAAITLLLMSSGAFDLLKSSLEQTEVHITNAQERTKKDNIFVSGWTNQLTEKTSELVNMGVSTTKRESIIERFISKKIKD
jgi:hypothetical protein